MWDAIWRRVTRSFNRTSCEALSNEQATATQKLGELAKMDLEIQKLQQALLQLSRKFDAGWICIWIFSGMFLYVLLPGGLDLNWPDMFCLMLYWMGSISSMQHAVFSRCRRQNCRMERLGPQNDVDFAGRFSLPCDVNIVRWQRSRRRIWCVPEPRVHEFIRDFSLSWHSSGETA